MLRFAANLTTMFREPPMAERFAAAKNCGFEAVEILYPYEHAVSQVKDWLEQSSLELILVNTPPSATGDVGLASLTGREADFRESFELSLSYAHQLGASMIHVLAGLGEAETFVKNLSWAANRAADIGISLMLEPLNTRDVPGYLHTTSQQTIDLITKIARDNVQLQYDFYHMQIMEGDLATHLQQHFTQIGHVQFSSVPGRHEPQYGEVNLDPLITHLDQLGYGGWIGCEYSAKEDTASGLSWAAEYGLGLPT